VSGEALIATPMLGEGTEIPCRPGIKDRLLFCLKARSKLFLKARSKLCCSYIMFVRGDSIFNHCLQLDKPHCTRTASPQLIFPVLSIFIGARRGCGEESKSCIKDRSPRIKHCYKSMAVL